LSLGTWQEPVASSRVHHENSNMVFTTDHWMETRTEVVEEQVPSELIVPDVSFDELEQTVDGVLNQETLFPEMLQSQSEYKRMGSSVDSSAESMGSSLTLEAGQINHLADYQAVIQAHLEQIQRYPALARRRGWEGAVVLRFVLDAQGLIRGEVQILQASRYPALNQAALETLDQSLPLPPWEAGLGFEEIVVVVPLYYRLSNG